MLCRRSPTWLRAVLQQRLHNVDAACSCGLKESCLAVALPCILPSTMADHELHSLYTATLYCQMQGRFVTLQCTYNMKLRMPIGNLYTICNECLPLAHPKLDKAELGLYCTHRQSRRCKALLASSNTSRHHSKAPESNCL